MSKNQSRRAPWDLEREQKLLRKIKAVVERQTITPAGLDSLRGLHGFDRFQAAREAERTGWVEAGSTALKAKGPNYSLVGYRLRFVRHLEDGTKHEMTRQVMVTTQGDIRDTGDQAEQLGLEPEPEPEQEVDNGIPF